MSKVPLGKVLLRNVIRHTGAHNKARKLLNETDMWKQRNLEQQASSTHLPKQSGQMHCDRYLDSKGSMQDRLGDRLSERDEKEARYWTRKLYEFEANDPDRWGHSGFKELYPEEFQLDGKKDCSDSKHRRKKRSIALKPDMEKNSKKSSKKKKKKKKKKKRTGGSGSESCSGAEDSRRREESKKAGKNKHRKKKHKSKERTQDSSSEDSHSEKRLKTRRKRDCLETDTLTEPRTKKRKNWRVGKDERSEESSDG
ncbi:NKAP domain containing protein 1 [Triplophysa tibetana]|uniref:NKAP domain containing protein 1 n=1 Tax=Triplophysa tibetana TaxID=1572043 RepID=A0A5A9MY61_9TELE|nr:NKAP domain containing protein 1 [Triplophysa tibetana]